MSFTGNDNFDPSKDMQVHAVSYILPNNAICKVAILQKTEETISD